MAIEVRELVIKCEVRDDSNRQKNEVTVEAMRRLRRDLLAECQRRIDAALRRARER